jgi:hypothetical protein
MYTYDPIPPPQFKMLQRIFCKQEEKLLFFGSVSGCTCLRKGKNKHNF